MTGPPRALLAAIMENPLMPVAPKGHAPVGTDVFASTVFMRHAGEDWRYCFDFKCWLSWDGRRWLVDRTGQHRLAAKNAFIAELSYAIKTSEDKLEKAMRSALDRRRIDAALHLAEPELAITAAELDQDPNSLNCFNGTIDLQTSALRKHSRRDFNTKVVAYDYNPRAKCELWLTTLHRLMGGGADASEADLDRAERMVAYLQRIFGYALTGLTSEKAVFVPFGAGNNGKSTLLTTYRRVIEQYAAYLDINTLMTKQESNNTQADLADLRGARFVQSSEAEEGQRLSQGKLKRITQGMGVIKAVRKYENPIEFPETHKLFLDTNRKPEIADGDDRATFNRLHPIPFTVTISEDEIDRELPEKLMAEAEGILAWAVEGARLWFESGLQRPREITAARAEWQAESDQIGRFLDDCCVVLETLRTSADQLYYQYSRWIDRSGEHRPVTANAFGRKMASRGFQKQHTKRGSVYQGVGLNPDRCQEGGER